MRLVTFSCFAIIALGIMALVDHPSTSAASAPQPAVATTPKSNPVVDQQFAKACEKKLDLIEKKYGVYASWKVDGEGFGTVEVRGPYYRLTFDSKSEVNSVFRCIMTDGRLDGLKSIAYLDVRTHKEVAAWSRYTGFSVD
jgi:hypothetical protein